MKLVTFRTSTSTGIGALRPDGSVVDFGADPDLPTDMVAFISLGEGGLARAEKLIATSIAIPVEQLRLLAPLRPRNNVMCVGKNYVDHAKEFAGSGFDASQAIAIPSHPIIFSKALSSIIGPNDDIDVSADDTHTSDYEGELGVVIGVGGTKIPANEARLHIYGYTIVNDMTVRELQKQHVQFFLGKSAATYCPLGPYLVTADEMADLDNVWVRTTDNGEERQSAPVSDLIFDIPTLIATISRSVALEPGDLIATGTPAGVGIGFDPPRYVQPGDVIDVSVDGIGTLSNRAR